LCELINTTRFAGDVRCDEKWRMGVGVVIK
jgi:hypothetical protein